MEFSVNVFGYASSVVRPCRATMPCRDAHLTVAVDRVLLLVHGKRFDMASASICTMPHWGAPCCRLASDARKPTVEHLASVLVVRRSWNFRWLIDNDKDEEGMRVIADLHGGDPEDLVARAEFQEIKERVMLEVGASSLVETCMLMALA